MISHEKLLLAYADQISRQPGETVGFKVSSSLSGEYGLNIVRIRCGDDEPGGPGLKQTVVDTNVNRSYPARFQKTQVGSFARIDECKSFALTSFTLQAMIWPTMPGEGRQAILGRWCEATQSGYALLIDDNGRLAVQIGDGSGKVQTLSSTTALVPGRWCLAGATLDAESTELHLYQLPQDRYGGAGDTTSVTTASTTVFPKDAEGDFLIAGWNDRDDGGEPKVSGVFNGKIDSPRVWRKALGKETIESMTTSPTGESLVAAWDFSLDIPGVEITDTSGNAHHGHTFNLPTRAMKGWNHDGSEMNWNHKPAHYGAIHFHDDDVYDAGWETDVSWTLPNDLASGVYAAHLTQNGHEFYVPLYVTPKRGTTGAKLCLLIATASYYAYVNNHMSVDWGSMGEHSSNEFASLTPTDLHLQLHPEPGLSMYDDHSDGSGVCYASRLRPMLRMGPHEDLWQYNADSHITDWLEEKDIDFDVVTDDDLDVEGVGLLEAYDCVMTTTHPEYYSKPMMQGLLDYQQQGGRFIYMGGNGFYWRVAYHPTLPGVIEMRRSEDGMRSWIAEPGEYYMSFTGELSGLWCRSGLAPEVICGTSFSSQGFNFGRPYQRTEESHNPRVAWMFEGISQDEPIGDFGLLFGGAAGSEVDSVNLAQGTPPHALVVASANDFGADFHWVVEEYLHAHSAVNGENCPHVRCDMVFYETPNGGAVFSTSSIAFAGSLSHNQYDNNISQLLGNVVTRFLDPNPLNQTQEG